MSYQITFAPKEEDIKNWKKTGFDSFDNEIKICLMELVSICMNHAHKNVGELVNSLRMRLTYLASLINLNEKNSAYEQWKKEGKIWYCGRGIDYESSYTKEETIDHYIEELYMYAEIIPTRDWYENQENFDKKFQDVWRVVREFEDDMQAFSIKEIIDYLEEIGAIVPEKSDKCCYVSDLAYEQDGEDCDL